MKQRKPHPGRPDRKGISLVELFEMFPDSAAAEAWFERQRWPQARVCPRCGSERTSKVKNRKPMPYRCKDCRRHFSVKVGTAMEASNLNYQVWAFAIYMVATSLKGVSSMKLHRDLKIRQPSAWHLAQRIREGFGGDIQEMAGSVEADETFVGGKVRNMPARKRIRYRGTGSAGKVPVAGIRDRSTNQVRANVVEDVSRITLQTFVLGGIATGAKVYTDEASAYDRIPNREKVKHGVGEYVRGQAHTNGIESFWAMLKRAHKGTFHQLNAKHLQRYLDEFAGSHNMRGLDTIDQMASIARGLDRKRLRYRELVG